MQLFAAWLRLLLLAQLLSLCSPACPTCPLDSTCKSTYCSCNSGYIFNCSYPATSPGTNTLVTLFSGIANYMVLSADIEKELGYNINVVMTSGSNIVSALNANTFIDEGVAIGAVAVTSEFSQSDLNVLNIQTALKLTYQPNTEDPERFVLMLNLTGGGPQTVYLSYEVYSLAGNNLFLILGYVAGGLLVAVSIFFIVLLYRKRRTQREQRQSSLQEEKKPIDISHFDGLMPAVPISGETRRDVQACSVCLQEFEFDVVIRRTVCQHVFHKECIDEWCLKNLTCPMCRADLSHMNILKLRVENAKKEETSDWVVNTLNEGEDEAEAETSQRPISLADHHNSIRQPLYPNASAQVELAHSPQLEVLAVIGNEAL